MRIPALPLSSRVNRGPLPRMARQRTQGCLVTPLSHRGQSWARGSTSLLSRPQRTPPRSEHGQGCAASCGWRARMWFFFFFPWEKLERVLLDLGAETQEGGLQPLRKPASKKLCRPQGDCSHRATQPFLLLRRNFPCEIIWNIHGERWWATGTYDTRMHLGGRDLRLVVLPLGCWPWPVTLSSLGPRWLFLSNQHGLGWAAARLRNSLLKNHS